ncbi:tRNA dihydrouridine(20/20a) synthase DusA [Agaribacter flavus]|uniref:tRNA-dihydrouridine(20/20a) synthase n=1 Tax=Agaribacter flavus TaxID=1902781 RepID=A0ABV7FS17_9ALTE
MSPSISTLDHRFSVAPMLDWTDRHCRYFLRLLSKKAVLYTEMVTTGAIIFGKGDYLSFHPHEHPLVLQLGGSKPEDMARCAIIAQQRGYNELNINVGCPSDRVKNGSFGACLMAEPKVVAECVSAMKDSVDIPITVKCRIGIDDMDDDEGLTNFVEPIVAAGCEHFIVHARKAWLQGLSPKENREVPPLNYERVYRLKAQFPDIQISINGGIKSLKEAQGHLALVDGVMLGREVYTNPYLLSEVDQVIYHSSENVISRQEVLEQMTDYMREQISNGSKAWHIARHTLGLFQGQPGGKVWRRFLSQHAPKERENPYLLEMAFEAVQNSLNK